MTQYKHFLQLTQYICILLYPAILKNRFKMYWKRKTKEEQMSKHNNKLQKYLFKKQIKKF